MADKKVKKAEEVKTIDQLREALEAKQLELLEARKANIAGELVNPRAITGARKEIARLKTAIRADELSQKENK